MTVICQALLGICLSISAYTMFYVIEDDIEKLYIGVRFISIQNIFLAQIDLMCLLLLFAWFKETHLGTINGILRFTCLVGIFPSLTIDYKSLEAQDAFVSFLIIFLIFPYIETAVDPERSCILNNGIG